MEVNMFDEKQMTADDVKKILMLYGNLQRLEVLNQKIQKSSLQSVKTDIIKINKIQDTEKRITEMGKCIVKVVDEWEENKKNITLCNSTIHNILVALEKIIVSDKDDANDGGRNGLE